MNEMFGNFYFENKSSYVDSDRILRSSNLIIFNNPFANKNLERLENMNYFNNNLKNLKELQKKISSAAQPYKIFLSSFEYNLLKKHVEHFDQQMSMGAGHSFFGNN